MTPDLFQMTKRQRNVAFWFMGMGLAALVWAFFKEPTRAWVNIFLGSFYLLSLGLAALLFMAIHYLTSSSWWVGIRRVAEAAVAVWWVASLLMLSLYFGRSFLYPWAEPSASLHDPLLMKKAPWLNVPFFFGRMVVILGIWGTFAFLFRKISRREDQARNPEKHHQKLVRLSALFIPIFAVTFCIASFDWLMSLEPLWYSTIYAIYNFSGLFLHGTAVLLLMTLLLKEKGHLSIVNENHLQDLAKIILAFSTFWVCMWVNQYMLIWYSNISEEAVYYVLRTDPDWHWLFLLNVVVNWGVPFPILLVRRSKRSPGVLKRVCLLLLFGHWLDLYLMIAPGVVKTRSIGPIELLTSLGFGALFLIVAAKALSQAPLVALKDPYLEESLEHHQ